MAALKFASSHNMVTFLDKPSESDGFEQIATTKVKTVNREVQIQALVDKKKVIISETNVRSDLQLEDAEVFLDKQVEGMSKHKEIYVTPSHTKKVIANMKRQGKDFSGRDTPLFPTMIVQAQEQVGEDSEVPTDSHHTPTTTEPSISKPHKIQSKRKHRKDNENPQLNGPTKPVTDDTENMASVPTHSNDPLLSGEDRLKLNELMELCTSLSQRVLDLEKTKTSQAAEITDLKKRVKKLEGKRKSKPSGMKRLFKISRSARVVSSEDEGLGDQEDASKQGRKIDEIDQDAEVTLVDETQGRYGDNLMYDTGVLDNEQDMAEKEVDMAEKDASTEKKVSTADLVITAVDELTLAQTLIEIKVAKPKAVTTATTTTTIAVAKPKARGVIVQEPNYELPARLQAKEQGELTIKEKSRLFKQKLDENVEAKVDDDQEEAKMKKHMEIVPDDEVAIDAIPLATNPPIIVDWKIIKEGKMGYFQIIRADGSSIRPDEAYERVLCGDLKVMFKPDVESEV
ncbi:hypothetical protein Tco_1483300 [Tanacetum coccineum]